MSDSVADVCLVVPEHQAQHDTGTHPETAARVHGVVCALRHDAQLRAACRWERGRSATLDEVSRVHTPGHIALVAESVAKARETGRRVALDPDTVVSAGSYTAALSAVGATLAAVEAVGRGDARRAFVAVRPPGHHATAGRAMGFCLFNNVALAARQAQHLGFQRVLIVDWDVHHGNGTQEIFYADPSVFFFSVHQFPHYPGTGSRWECGTGDGTGYTLNVPLPAGTSAAEYRAAFEAALATITRQFRPDFVLISAGFDAHISDPLGDLNLTDADFVHLTRLIVDVAETCCGGRVVSVLEGGYNLTTLPQTVCAHVAALTADRSPPP